MTLEQLIRSLNPEIYRNLRTAIELGRWPDGRRLTQEQRELCMEAVIYYENLHQVAEQERVGYIDRNKVEQTSCSSTNHEHDHDDAEEPVSPTSAQPIKWIN